MVWGGGLEDTIPEAHPTDQYSAHHRVPGEPCSFLYHQPGCWHPFVSLANPHSSRRVTVRFSTCAFPSSPLPPFPPGVWIVRGLETTFTYVHHVVCTRVKYTSMHPLIPRS